MKHSLTVVAIGGLCNRMRVLASLYHLSPTLSHHVHVVWRAHPECQATFDQLFEPLPEPRLQLSVGSCFDRPARRSNLLVPSLWRVLRGMKEYRDFYPPQGFSLSQLDAHRSYYFDTCSAFCDYPRHLVPILFVPLPALQQQIADVTAAFGPRTVGVHIRRTDHVVAMQHSPLEAFEARIDHLLDQGQADSIFLCSDDAAVRTRFTRRYGTRLLTRQVNLSRGELTGIQDAVIDLWSLAHTSFIVGSYYSSFSDTAAEIYGIPLESIDVLPPR